MKKVAVFADQDVGLEVVRFLLENRREEVLLVVTTAQNEIFDISTKHQCKTVLSSEITELNAGQIIEDIDFIFLAWWPRIVKKYIIDSAREGVINFHPSLLPYNRGKHYNFWTIVEDSPFGVTLHFVDEGVDTGDIIFQKKIQKSWEDTGETLYHKAKSEMLALFKESYEKILSGNFEKIKQEPGAGSMHYSKELDGACEIDLDKTYTARELLNIMRARTFTGKPGSFFYDNGIKYEINIAINQIDKS